MSDRRYCSLLSEQLPLAGTCDHTDVWLLLEYKPNWSARVFEDNALAAATRQWLADSIQRLTGQGLRVRPQFIRQPEYDRQDLSFLIADQRRTWHFKRSAYQEFHELDVVALLGHDDSEPPPAVEATAIEAAHYFVCMNGKRDICCARFGRPIYQQLREAVGERVWQISHVGGHRFAPNVLALPQGGMYGRLSEDRLAEFVRLIESGALDFGHLRGRSWFPPLVQAAEAFAEVQGLQLQSINGDESAAEVIFQAVNEGSTALAVEVRKAEQPVMALASCTDAAAKPSYPFILVR